MSDSHEFEASYSVSKMKQTTYKFLTALSLIIVVFITPIGVLAQGDDDIIGGSRDQIAGGSSVFVAVGSRKPHSRSGFRSASVVRTVQVRTEYRRKRLVQSREIAKTSPRIIPKLPVPPKNNAKEMAAYQASVEMTRGANVYLSQNQLQKAGEQFFEAITLKPDNVEAKVGLAKVYEARGDAEYETQNYENAIALYEKGLEYDKENADLYAALGDSYEAFAQTPGAPSDTFRRALESYETALRINPKLTSLKSPLGILHLAAGNNEKAAEYLRDALRETPDDAKAQDAYGIALYKLERYNEALDELRKAADKNTANATTFYYLGETYDRFDREKEAIEAYNRAVQIDPKYAEAYFDLGVAYYNRGQYENAAENYRKVVALKSSYTEARLNLADTLQKLERYNDAINQYQVVLSIKPDDASVLTKFGYAQGKTRNWKRAAELLTVAAEKEPTAAHLTNLAWAHNGDKNFAAAKASAQKALQSDNKFAAAYFNLGIAQANLKEFRDAEASFKQALSLKKDWADAHNNLGFVYMNLNEWEKAAETLSKSVEADPKFAAARFNLGVAEIKRGKVKNAERERDALVNLNSALAVQLDAIIKTEKKRQ